jgi:nucleoside-diphosphate-sugar epimerase
MTGQKKALVLGASGGIGGETAAALVRHGWDVTAMARDVTKRGRGRSEHLAGIKKWLQGDAMVGADTLRAAEGVHVIIHAVNPPGYHNWGGLVLPMVKNSIAAAKAVGARVVVPGGLYNYGHDAFPLLQEDAPQNPVTEKGRIRMEVDRHLEAGSRDGARALMVCFGDFFGPVPGGNWFEALIKPGKTASSITYPGQKGIGHSWAYLPDAGETIASLLDREDELGDFARFNFEGVWDADGTAMIEAIRAALHRPELKVKPLPWWLLRLAGFVLETPREISKMRYLWQHPVRLDNRKLVAFLGAEPHTPLRDAVGTTLTGLRIS